MVLLVWSLLPELCGIFVANSLLLRDFLECQILRILYYLTYMSHMLVVLRIRMLQAEKQCVIFLSFMGTQPLHLIRLS